MLLSGQLNCQDCWSVSFLPKFFSLISPIIYTYLDILPLSIYILYLNQIREEKKRDFFFILEHHYLLEFNLAQPAAAERWVQGFLKVNLYGTESEITDVDLTPE